MLYFGFAVLAPMSYQRLTIVRLDSWPVLISYFTSFDCVYDGTSPNGRLCMSYDEIPLDIWDADLVGDAKRSTQHLVSVPTCIVLVARYY